MELDVAKWGLGPQMDTASVPDNPWMHFVLIDAQAMLRFVAQGLPINLVIPRTPECKRLLCLIRRRYC